MSSRFSWFHCTLFYVALSASAFAQNMMTIYPQVWERNGSSTVPMGLLGVHNVPLDEAKATDWGVTGMRRIHQIPGAVSRIPEPGRRQELEQELAAATDKKEKRRLKRQLASLIPSTFEWTIDCFYDRYQPALQVRNPTGWETELRERVRAFVANARKSGQQHRLEFWNEPYLNWAVNPAVNVSPQYYVTEGIQVGDPMVLKATGEAVPGLEWGPKRFYVVERGSINYVLSGYILANAKPGKPTRLRFGAGTVVPEIGGTINLRGRERQLGYGHWGRDVKQKHYWSGPVSVKWYNEMLQVVGEEMDALGAEEIPLAGGWGFNIFNEGWDSWKYLVKPMIDACHPWLDAIHEHHYGGDTRLVGMSYEVAYSYAQATYGNRLEFWNTEAGGHLDPQQPGNAQPHNHGDPLTKARASMTYLLRDVIYQWAHVPDKAKFRAAHHSHYIGGDPWAFRLLKPMAGDLLVLNNPMQDVWAVASRGDEATTVMLFNNRRQQVDLTLNLPVDSGEAKTAAIETRDGKLVLQESTASFQNGKVQVRIPATSALRVTVPVFQTEKTVRWDQFASADVLTPMGSGLETKVHLPAETLKHADSAGIRLVIGQPLDSITLRIENVSQTIENLPYGISDHALSDDMHKALTETTTLRVEGSGTLLATSLWLKR